MKITTQSDYQCVKMYQAGKNKKIIMTHLWAKYLPLTRKVSRQNCRYGHTNVEFEDIVQECYFSFPQVMNKINLSEVDPKLFSFGQSLKNYLRGNTQAISNTEMKRNNRTMTEFSYANDEQYFMRIPETYISKQEIEKDFLKQESINILKTSIIDFLMKCNPHEQFLFDLLVEKETSCEYKTCKEWIKLSSRELKVGHPHWAKKKEVSPTLFYGKTQKLKLKFIQHMNKYGYYSHESLRSVGLNKLA